eukprot:scaffold4837_cov121-Isochrysis_galbana.AAC.2
MASMEAGAAWPHRLSRIFLVIPAELHAAVVGACETSEGAMLRLALYVGLGRLGPVVGIHLGVFSAVLVRLGPALRGWENGVGFPDPGGWSIVVQSNHRYGRANNNIKRVRSR